MPSIPKITKNVQQMRTTFPIGRRDDSKVITTNFRPGARLITLPIIKYCITILHYESSVNISQRNFATQIHTTSGFTKTLQLKHNLQY